MSQLSKGGRKGEEDRKDKRRVRFLDKKTLSIYPAKGITKIRILVSVRIDRNLCEETVGIQDEEGWRSGEEGKELRGWRGHRGSTSPLRSCQRTFHMKINQINRLFQTFA